MVKGFSKMYNLSFFGQIFFCKNFFADSKSRAQELSNNVSFVIFGHKTWDLEGGGSPPSISWFSSTPAEIGLKKYFCVLDVVTIQISTKIFYHLLCITYRGLVTLRNCCVSCSLDYFKSELNI